MSTPVSVALELVNDKVRFRGSARGLPPLDADYFPPLGDAEGYSGLELLLLSLAACSATSVLPLLRRKKKAVSAFRVNASGVRRTQHPTGFEHIDIEFVLTSPDATVADLQEAVAAAEGLICPVWAMLKNSVEIVPALRVIAPGG